MSKIIRISEEAYIKLSELAEALGAPRTRVVEKALDKLAGEQLLKRANRAYEELMKDPQAWQEELEERKDWEATLGDGLESL